MRRLAVLAAVFFVSACATGQGARSGACELCDPNPAPSSLKVTLPSVTDGTIPFESVYDGFGCEGENKSLPISWSGAPEGTRSYAVIIHDPDAPTGVGFFHWTVFNLPADTTQLELGASQTGLPEGAIQANTDFGVAAYGGPCPPPGAPHRYIATVYALKVEKLPIDATATGALLRFMLADNTLALGRATGTYGR